MVPSNTDFFCEIVITLINKHDEGTISRETIITSVYLKTGVKEASRINESIDDLIEETEFIDGSDGEIKLIVANFTYFKLNNILKEDCNWTEDDIQSQLDPLFSDSYHKPI
jgi:hypothetical protein